MENSGVCPDNENQSRLAKRVDRPRGEGGASLGKIVV